MSKPSRRPIREACKEHTKKRREAQRCLLAAQAQAGMVLLRRAIADDPTAGGEPGIESPGVCGYLTGVVSGVGDTAPCRYTASAVKPA
jgi:hypothetical protein